MKCKLALNLTIESIGDSNSSVDNWIVNYSCQFKQLGAIIAVFLLGEGKLLGKVKSGQSSDLSKMIFSKLT